MARIFCPAYKEMWDKRLALSKQLYYISNNNPIRSKIEEELRDLKIKMREMEIHGEHRFKEDN